MKFYRDKINSYFWHKIKNNKLTSVYQFMFGYKNECTHFFKNGVHTNAKNVAEIYISGYKTFLLNGKYYGNEDDFTKESWRRFVKMKVFL
jgi:hypothetical protein